MKPSSSFKLLPEFMRLGQHLLGKGTTTRSEPGFEQRLCQRLGEWCEQAVEPVCKGKVRMLLPLMIVEG